MSGRRSIDERAAQRERMERSGGDRYRRLLHTLQAGQELPWRPRVRTAPRLRWHPITGTLLRAALLGVVLWLAVTAILGIWRDNRTDMWTGPDATVTSGQRLANCPLVDRVRDDLFPSWIRFDGAIYRLSDTIRPMGFEPDPGYPATGHRLGSMALFRVANTPEGQAGQIIVVKLDSSAVGRVFRVTPDCS